MSNNTSQRGSIVLVIVVVVLLVGALGFVGWRMLARQNAEGQAPRKEASCRADCGQRRIHRR